jgi:hypothetical protein
MPTAAAEIQLSDHLRKIPPTVRPMVDAAIRTIKEVAPKANEVTYRSRPPGSTRAMWKIVRFAVDGVNIVGIGTSRAMRPCFSTAAVSSS